MPYYAPHMFALQYPMMPGLPPGAAPYYAAAGSLPRIPTPPGGAYYAPYAHLPMMMYGAQYASELPGEQQGPSPPGSPSPLLAQPTAADIAQRK
jgi:hypothetical protein